MRLAVSRVGWNGTPHYRRAGGSTFWFKKFLAIVFSGLDQALNLALGQMLPRSILSIGLADWVMSNCELRSSQNQMRRRHSSPKKATSASLLIACSVRCSRDRYSALGLRIG